MGSIVSDLARASDLQRQPRLLIAACIALGATALWFVGQRLHYLTSYSLASYTVYFWGRRIGLLAHLLGGTIALCAGLIQTWLGLSERVGRLHRLVGRAYVGAVSLACPAGVYLALTIPQHFTYASGLFFLAVAWAVTTAMAVYAVWQGHVAQHRDWMLRSYTVTFAFVLFRLGDSLLHGVFRVPEDPVADNIDSMTSWACWTVPLLAMEVAIQLRSMQRR